MPRIAKTLLLALSLAVSSTAVFAQGSGSTAPSTPATPNFHDAYQVKRSVTGVIQKIDEAQRIVLFTDEKNGEPWGFQASEEIRFRTDKGIFEKKKITWTDLAKGHRIRVEFRAEARSGELRVAEAVASVKVRKLKKTRSRRGS